MASNTKYQPAPQRDSFDEGNYTEAPPSYQAEASRASAAPPAHGGGIFGAPREEDDNVPDDFKYGGMVAEASLSIRMQFIRKVYAILTVQLLATVGLSVVSVLSKSYSNWIQTNSWMLWVALIGSIATLLLTYWKRKSYPTNLLFLGAFTALEAYTISVVVAVYSSHGRGRIVLEALVITLGIFIALTLFACQTRYDFTAWQPYVFGMLWVFILMGFVSVFIPHGSTMELILGGVAALIFSAYILIDTQMVMRHYHVEEEIAAAISLYLDIINLFLAILRILNSQQNN